MPRVLDRRGVETRGHWSISAPESRRLSNAWLWFNLSQEAADVLVEVLSRAKLEPAHPLVYLVDGCVPGVATVKAMRHYKKPRWLPVVVNPR